MVVSIFYGIIAFYFYHKSKRNLETQFIYENFSFILIFISVSILVIVLANDNMEKNLFYLLLIPLFILCIRYINKRLKIDLSIKANQQRYFDEVNAKMIYNFYQKRKVIKSNRVETLVNEESKKIIKNGYIVPEFFLNYKNMQFTKIEKIEEIENYEIHNIIFKKIKGFIKELEVKVDYQKELEKNKNCLEFLLMQLWEDYAKKFNISVANLDVLAKNEVEIEFLGALDLLYLNSIKRKGATLYYKYLEHKDRLKEYLKKE